MKIAVTSTGQSLEAPLDPRLGRCRYILLVDPETLDMEVLDNVDAMGAGGAGVAVAQKLIARGVTAVLTGNCGPNAFQVLSAAGIKVVTGVTGTVRDAVKKYASGQLEPSSQPTVPGHFGMGGGWGRGGGHGHGMGHGCGRDRGV